MKRWAVTLQFIGEVCQKITNHLTNDNSVLFGWCQVTTGKKADMLNVKIIAITNFGPHVFAKGR